MALLRSSLFAVVILLCSPLGSTHSLRADEAPMSQPADSADSPEKNWKVSALVNGKPIYEEELLYALGPQLQIELPFGRYSPSERKEKLREIIAKQRDTIIDQELMYQDAVATLQTRNPKALAKAKKYAHEDFEKKMAEISERQKDTNFKLEGKRMREIAEILERETEREFIAIEYVKSRCIPRNGFSSSEIKEFYQKHPDRFQQPETVFWQHIFIAVGDKHPTLAEARKHAVNLTAQCKTGEDFQKLISMDERPAAEKSGKWLLGDEYGISIVELSPGDGFGAHRGQIKPREAEEQLFQLRDGEIGPVMDADGGKGVHIIRLVKREPAGLMRLDEKLQERIRNILRQQLYEREHERLVRDLRSRAKIEIVEDPAK